MSPEEEERLEALKRQARLERAQETQRDQVEARRPADQKKTSLMTHFVLTAVIGAVVVGLGAWGFRSVIVGWSHAKQDLQKQNALIETIQQKEAARAFAVRWSRLGIDSNTVQQQKIQRINGSVFVSTVQTGGGMLSQTARFTCDDSDVNRQLTSCYAFEP